MHSMTYKFRHCIIRSMNSDPSPAENKPATISGSKVVGAMFVMGILGGVLCVTFAIWHNAPFLELKKALAAEFPKSVPQVEGGSHKGSPMMLRIIVNAFKATSTYVNLEAKWPMTSTSHFSVHCNTACRTVLASPWV